MVDIAKKLNLNMPEWFNKKDYKDFSHSCGNISYDNYVNDESNERIVIARCNQHSESELFGWGEITDEVIDETENITDIAYIDFIKVEKVYDIDKYKKFGDKKYEIYNEAKVMDEDFLRKYPYIKTVDMQFSNEEEKRSPGILSEEIYGNYYLECPEIDKEGKKGYWIIKHDPGFGDTNTIEIYQALLGKTKEQSLKTEEYHYMDVELTGIRKKGRFLEIYLNRYEKVIETRRLYTNYVCECLDKSDEYSMNNVGWNRLGCKDERFNTMYNFK